MRQVSFSLGTGEVTLEDLPYPSSRAHHLIVAVEKSLMSVGTERMLLNFGKAGWMDKIRQQPDKVRDVLAKIRSEGLLSTLDAVRAKLDQPIPIGYSSVGRVLDVGEGVQGFSLGDRVVSNGPHAQVVRVPVNLCAKVPPSVSDESASFTVVASIAMQGVRLAAPTIGEDFVVIGLGLIGLLTCQLLQAQGCRVLACDFDSQRLSLARTSGVTAFDLSGDADVVAWVFSQTDGRGADGVLIAASTSSSEPVRQAAQMSRKRGRVVLIGVSGLELSRADFYEKELTFQVSCSYGPGRYDGQYEQQGQDYPFAFVRWTAQRNFQSILQLIDSGRLNVGRLVTHRFPFTKAREAYRALEEDKTALGVIFEYDAATGLDNIRSTTIDLSRNTKPSSSTMAFIGSGNYAIRMLAPGFAKAGADLRILANTGSLQGGYAARRFGFRSLTSDVERVFADDGIDAVVIATQHDSHAALTVRALQAGKHVFVEKPLALTLADIDAIEAAVQACNRTRALLQLCVGFNRRFSPIGLRMRDALARISGPKSLVYSVNAGAIPSGHWSQLKQVGGGRIVGECCHFIDFLRFLVGYPIDGFTVEPLLNGSAPRDTVTLTLRFTDGSIGTIHYFANGARSLAKERLEVFAEGRVLQMENFRRLSGRGWGHAVGASSWRPDKGQVNLTTQFVRRVRNGGSQLIPFDELWEVSRISILAQQAIDAR